MKGLIVGGGIAGLMSAIAFELEGIDFDIVESASSYKPLGAGIIIPPNAMFILSQYGLDEKVIEHGAVIEHMSMCNHHGASLAYMPCNYDYLGKTLQSVAIPRSQLHSLLLQHLKTPIQMGRKCVDVLPSDNGLVVSFNDGSTLESDFVIAADGVNSSIRKRLFSQQTRGNKHRYC